MRSLFLISITVVLFSCNGDGSKGETKKLVPPTISKIDSTLMRTTKLFTAAVAEYINEFYKKEKPDTLFLSKNPDFPNINLAARIQNVPVRLIETEEGYSISDRRPMTILNLIDLGGDGFMIVTFKDRYIPQFNCQLYFTFSKYEYKLDSLRKTYPYAKNRR